MDSISCSHRKCAHCGRRFRIDPRVRRLHRFCSRPVCAKVSRVTSQRRWLKRERERQIQSKADVYRTQEWRRSHPGYWRRKATIGQYVVRGELAQVVRDFALQDMTDWQFSLVVGLVSYLTRSALQDTIASEIRRLIVAGHVIRRNALRALWRGTG